MDIWQNWMFQVKLDMLDFRFQSATLPQTGTDYVSAAVLDKETRPRGDATCTCSFRTVMPMDFFVFAMKELADIPS